MAQDTFINLTADKSASRKLDVFDHRHDGSFGIAAAGDFSITYDKAVVTTLTMLDSLYRKARALAVSSGLK